MRIHMHHHGSGIDRTLSPIKLLNLEHQLYETDPTKDLVHSEKRDIGDSMDPPMPAGKVWAIQDTHLVGYEWVLLSSYKNTSDVNSLHRVPSTTSLRVLEGEEAAESLQLKAGFKDMGIEMETDGSAEHKTFAQRETTTTEKMEETYEVKAHESVFAYQKRYRFRLVLRWLAQSSSDGQWFQWGSKEWPLEIDSDEFAHTATALEGRGELVTFPVESASPAGEDLPAENPPSQLWEQLQAKGIVV